MAISGGLLLVVGIVYLLLLFGAAFAAELRIIPERISSHPLTYVLALGVYASGYALYGITGLAADYGMAYLNYYLGLAIVFFLMPVLIRPLYQICKTYRLNSVADLLSFRYRSQTAGTLATLLSCLAIWPLMAIQIETISESARILVSRNPEAEISPYFHEISGFIFCVFIAIFSLLFGSRSLSSRDSHRGMLVVLALESAWKFLAITAVGLAAVFLVFDGPSGIQTYFISSASATAPAPAALDSNSQRIMFLCFFSMATSMPTVFHMLFAEHPGECNLLAASWGLPLFLLGMSLPIMPIVWAAESLGYSPGDYAALVVSTHVGSDLLPLLLFVGGLSAASGAVAVTTLALASMSLSHLILPFMQPRRADVDVYRWLLRARQTLIIVIILMGYLLFIMLPEQQSLSTLLTVTATGCAQLGPGLLAVLYWPRANRVGLFCGLMSGISLWAVWLLLPGIGLPSLDLFHLSSAAVTGEFYWLPATAISLGTNSLVFIAVSILAPTTPAERAAAETCTIDDLNRPSRQRLNLGSAQEMGEQLKQRLGDTVARQEFERALGELELRPDETRPYALRRLRDQIEVNLSALVGPAVARRIIDNALPYSGSAMGEGEDITFIEARLEQYQTSLTGLAADLDSLRRYHRQTLENLPIGVCSLTRDQEILMWNKTMADISDIESSAVLGSSLLGLPSAWADCLLAFSASSDSHWSKYALDTDTGPLWLNLHKTESHTQGREELLIVVEDISETQMLEKELTHQERLASIGRLAAGVAHEIGNPVTGIACLAQNLRYETENPDSLEAAEQIIKQTQRITSIVQSLVNFAHSGRDNSRQAHSDVNVRHCVGEAMHLLSLDNEARRIYFNNNCGEDIYIIGDSQRLVQVFINLLANSRDAAPEGSQVSVETAIESTDEQARVHITVTDRGGGIDAAARERLFEPFFTTKEPGKGTGLGLALVYNIIQDFNGEISIESPVAEFGEYGTRVHILLPTTTLKAVTN